METVTKIDIIHNQVNCYNELTGEKVVYSIDSTCDFFMNEFSDTQDLLTVNVYDPIPRIMKFYNINESIPQSFMELDYVDMSSDHQTIFDAFITMIKTK